MHVETVDAIMREDVQIDSVEFTTDGHGRLFHNGTKVYELQIEDDEVTPDRIGLSVGDVVNCSNGMWVYTVLKMHCDHDGDFLYMTALSNGRVVDHLDIQHAAYLAAMKI